MLMIDIENPMVRPLIVELEDNRKFCTCCHIRIFNEDLVYMLDGEVFCDEECMIDYLGAKTKHGWEI